MADKVNKVDKPVAKPVELPPRIHVNEFLGAHTDLNVLQKAGFKAVVRKEWMRLEEWSEQLVKYLKK